MGGEDEGDGRGFAYLELGSGGWRGSDSGMHGGSDGGGGSRGVVLNSIVLIFWIIRQAGLNHVEQMIHMQ